MAGGPEWELRDDRKGLPEFVGPNRIVGDLPEVAVVDLGSLGLRESHDRR